MIVFVDDVLATPCPTNLYDVADFADFHVYVSEVLDDDCDEHPPVILGAEITKLQICMCHSRCDYSPVPFAASGITDRPINVLPAFGIFVIRLDC